MTPIEIIGAVLLYMLVVAMLAIVTGWCVLRLPGSTEIVVLAIQAAIGVLVAGAAIGLLLLGFLLGGLLS